MLARLLFLYLAAFAALPIAVAAPAAPAVDPGITAFVETYFSSWSKGDFARYRACFDPGASISFKAGEKWLPWALPKFLDDQEQFQSTRRSEEVPLSTSVKAESPGIALVEVPWRLQRAGSKEVTTGIDWFTLVKTGEGWRIMHLTFWQDAPGKLGQP